MRFRLENWREFCALNSIFLDDIQCSLKNKEFFPKKHKLCCIASICMLYSIRF